MPVVVSLLCAIASGRNNSLCPLLLDAFYQRVCIVGFIGNHHLWFKTRKQCRSLSNISCLPGGKKPTQRTPQGIYRRMNFARQSAPGTSNGLFSIFFSAPVPCWCTRTMVLSMSNASKSGSSVTALTTCCQTPFLAQRENRVYVVCQLPSSEGKSRHGAPVRAIQSTASTKSRLSWAVAPGSLGLPGRISRIRSHWSSRKSFRSIFTPLVGYSYTIKMGENQ